MQEELENLLESKPFNEWQKLLAGKSGIIQLPTRWNLINGLCVDLGVYLSIRYKVPIFTLGYLLPGYLITVTHACVLRDGKYYDGWNVEGVTHPSDLQWSKLLIHNRQVYDKDTMIIDEGLMGSYDHIYHLAGLKKILEKYPLEES